MTLNNFIEKELEEFDREIFPKKPFGDSRDKREWQREVFHAFIRQFAQKLAVEMKEELKMEYVFNRDYNKAVAEINQRLEKLVETLTNK